MGKTPLPEKKSISRPLLHPAPSWFPKSQWKKHTDPNTTGDNLITHIVQTKETLFSISKKYGVDAAQLQQWNNLDSTSLKIGQELIIHKN